MLDSQSPARRAWLRFKANRLGYCSLLLFVALVLLSLGAELLSNDRPLLVQANAGLPQMRDGAPVWPETPDVYAGQAAALPALGVGIIGGCCGTTPAHIAALRRMLDAGR